MKIFKEQRMKNKDSKATRDSNIEGDTFLRDCYHFSEKHWSYK